MVDIEALNRSDPRLPVDRLRKPGLQGSPDVAHVYATEGFVGKIGEIDPEVGSRLDQRALVQALAVDEGAVDIPGDGAKDGHDAMRPARAR